MLGYAWVQLLQTLLNCFPKRLYFIFTQHGHVLVNTQYCVREEFFPSSLALPYRLSIVHVSWWFHCYPGLALCKNIFKFLKYLIEIHIVKLMSCLPSTLDICILIFMFTGYVTRQHSLRQNALGKLQILVVAHVAEMYWVLKECRHCRE